MDTAQLLELINKGESSLVQFKERIVDVHDFSKELVAFSNSKGGTIIIGVNDNTGKINSLSFEEIRAANEIIVAASTNNVKPPILVHSNTVSVEQQNVIVVEVNQGLQKPYKDKNGAMWIKNGADKRRVTANEEIARLLQESRTIFADEMPIFGTASTDINIKLYETIFNLRYQQKGVTFATAGLDLETSLRNQHLYKEGLLSLTGLLVFCDNRHYFRPQFSIQCFAINGNDTLGNKLADNEPAFDGNIQQVYFHALNFIDRNMRKVPSGDSFNSELKWEIPKEVFEEVLVNALVHRDYFINSTIKVFLYTNRIEVISPGKLPNSQTTATITNGVSIPRNPVLQSLCQYVLPYKGAGTGLMRALALYPAIEIENDTERDWVNVIIKR